MNNLSYLFFIVIFAFLGCSKKAEISPIATTTLVGEIHNSNNETWTFTYDKNKKVEYYLVTLDDGVTSIKYDITYNYLDQIASIESFYTNDVETKYQTYFSYDLQGELIASERTTDPDNKLTVSYENEITVYDFSNGQDLVYFLEDGNIVKENCFNCGPLIDEFKYSTFEIAIPIELKKIWPLTYSVPAFLGSNRILSKNIPVAYSHVRIAWGGEMINEIEIDEFGLPKKIKSYQGEAAFGENDPNDVNTWTIEYVEL